jgi:hypothetical protein
MQTLGAIAELWIAAVEDLARMCRRMWPVLLQVGALYVVAVMAWFTIPHLLHPWLGVYVARYLLLVGCAFATSPYFVALHRFVALDEVKWFPAKGGYAEASIYAAWSGIILLLQMSPIILFFSVEAATHGHDGLSALAAILAVPIAWIIATRLATLLPMAALDHHSATWAAAFGQSRKRFWFIWAATSAAPLPAYFALATLFRFGAPFAASAVFSILVIAGLLAAQLLPLSVSTRLFRNIHAETNRPGFPPLRQPRET